MRLKGTHEAEVEIFCLQQFLLLCELPVLDAMSTRTEEVFGREMKS